MMIRTILITTFAAALLLTGCALEPMAPSDLAGSYYAQSISTSSYYVIQIFTDTTGELYEYTWAAGPDPDDSSDDIYTLENTFDLTITVDFPWHFTGGPLDHDAYAVGRTAIRIPNFDSEELAHFAAAGTTYP